MIRVKIYLRKDLSYEATEVGGRFPYLIAHKTSFCEILEALDQRYPYTGDIRYEILWPNQEEKQQLHAQIYADEMREVEYKYLDYIPIKMVKGVLYEDQV